MASDPSRPRQSYRIAPLSQTLGGGERETSGRYQQLGPRWSEARERLPRLDGS